MLCAALATGCSHSAPPASAQPHPLQHYASASQLVAVASAQQRADRFAKLHVTGVTTDNPPQSMLGDGEISFDPSGTVMQLVQTIQPLNATPGPAFTLLILPNQAFLKPPPGTVSVPQGKSWFPIRQNPASPTVTQFNQMIESMRASADPAHTFAELGDAASVVQATDDTLSGVPAVRYTISLDLTKASQERDNPAVMRALADMVQTGGVSDDTQLWLDGRNRPLRLVLSRTMSDETGAHSTYVVTVRYRDWGQPVNIPVPDASQVVGN